MSCRGSRRAEKFTVQAELEHSSRLRDLHSRLGARIRLGLEPHQVDTGSGAVAVAVVAGGESLAPWGMGRRGEPRGPRSWGAWGVLQLP